jgi:hypothetical protein
LIDDDSIVDSVGNKSGGPGRGNGSFTTGEAYTISKASINFPPPSIRGFRQTFLTNNPTPSFAWTIVRGARTYEIIIGSDSSFTQIITSQMLNGLSYTVGPRLNDGIYYWHVRAYNSDLQPGRFSHTQSFTIDTTCPSAPALIGPIDNATLSTKPIFSWANVDSAISYRIEIDNDPDFSSLEFSSLRSDTSYRISHLPKGTYFWHVQAKDMAGNWGDWSTRFTLNIP